MLEGDLKFVGGLLKNIIKTLGQKQVRFL